MAMVGSTWPGISRTRSPTGRGGENVVCSSEQNQIVEPSSSGLPWSIDCAFAELEQRVRDRTAQLEAANQELESFAYSVSHDLRAPLRGIDGWSLALVEDFASQLDEEARHYLGRVRSEAQRMGQLIDDLLRLSRVTRAPLERDSVDLTALARSIADNLREIHADRRIDFTIQPGLTACGDA